MSSTDNLTITKDTPLAECPHKLLELVDNMKIKDGDSKALKESLQVLHKRVTEKEEEKSGWGQTYQVTYLQADYEFYEDNDDDDDAHLHIVYKPHTQLMKFHTKSLIERLTRSDWDKIKNFSAKEVCEYVKKSKPAHFSTEPKEITNYGVSVLDEQELHYEGWDARPRRIKLTPNSWNLQNFHNCDERRECYVHFNVNMFIVNIEPVE